MTTRQLPDNYDDYRTQDWVDEFVMDIEEGFYSNAQMKEILEAIRTKVGSDFKFFAMIEREMPTNDTKAGSTSRQQNARPDGSVFTMADFKIGDKVSTARGDDRLPPAWQGINFTVVKFGRTRLHLQPEPGSRHGRICTVWPNLLCKGWNK